MLFNLACTFKFHHDDSLLYAVWRKESVSSGTLVVLWRWLHTLAALCKIEHIYWAKCMLKSNNPLGKRIGVARLCHVEGVRCVLDSDQR